MFDPPKCTWKYDNPDDGEDSPFVSSCGEYMQFTHKGPVENGFKYCPYCGKELVT